MPKTAIKRSLWAIAAFLPLLLLGCAHVPAYQQSYLSKPGMTFSDSLIEDTQPQLTSQVEPGSETSGGAQSSGCSACR